MNKFSKQTMKAGILLSVILSSGAASAQWGGWGDGGKDTTAADTTAADTTSSGGGWGWGESKPADAMPKRAVYVRFIPPYDSLREIIYYEGVMELQSEFPEKNSPDSLYWRTKKFMVKRYGKADVKKWLVEDLKGNRMTFIISIPMVVESAGGYKKSVSGKLEYKFTVRFKDNQYKYQFGNFVHVESPNGKSAAPVRTYHEYYMRVKKGYQQTDGYLLAADREVKSIVEGLKKSLKDPYQPDEDDWGF